MLDDIVIGKCRLKHNCFRFFKIAEKYFSKCVATNTSKWNPREEILDESFLQRHFFKALKDEDVDSFKEILFAHIDAKVIVVIDLDFHQGVDIYGNIQQITGTF